MPAQIKATPLTLFHPLSHPHDYAFQAAYFLLDTFTVALVRGDLMTKNMLIMSRITITLLLQDLARSLKYPPNLHPRTVR
jgi:hypothetical protein